jgi:hypothetical protein
MRRHAHQHRRRLTDIARAVVDITDPSHQHLITELGNANAPAQKL